jgi:hypothetical protein
MFFMHLHSSLAGGRSYLIPSYGCTFKVGSPFLEWQFNVKDTAALSSRNLATATCATYSINWLAFITEMKSVYSAVRTGSLNIEVCTSSLKG